MKYIYEINESNEIRVWDTQNPNELNAPFFLQPDWPNGTPWTDTAEATAWVELFIESLENPESEFIPGDSPDEPKKLRPEPTEEI
jgi:hypothetical protein